MRIIVFHNFLAEYDPVCQIFLHHNFKEFAIKVAKKCYFELITVKKILMIKMESISSKVDQGSRI